MRKTEQRLHFLKKLNSCFKCDALVFPLWKVFFCLWLVENALRDVTMHALNHVKLYQHVTMYLECDWSCSFMSHMLPNVTVKCLWRWIKNNKFWFKGCVLQSCFHDLHIFLQNHDQLLPIRPRDLFDSGLTSVRRSNCFFELKIFHLASDGQLPSETNMMNSRCIGGVGLCHGKPALTFVTRWD